MDLAFVRRFTAVVIALATLAACSSNSGSISPANVLPSLASRVSPDSQTAYSTGYQYVVRFWPLWLFYQQSSLAPGNKLIGPKTMGPIYHAVVAPNDDTLYGSTILDVSQEPDVFTIPTTTVTYSVLSLDFFGNVIDTGISASGVYAFTGPGYKKKLPKGVIQVALPTNYSPLIVRADKFSASGTDQTTQAQAFIAALHSAPLSTWKSDPTAGATTIYPVALFGVPYKTIVDATVEVDPMKYLTVLQTAVTSSKAPPLTKTEQALSKRFNAYFSSWSKYGADLSAGARAAHTAILNYYLRNTGSTNWIHFSNIGAWSSPLMRSAIEEYIQCANSYKTAAYYQTFQDNKGLPLDASKHGYVMTFAASQIPKAKRFWSVTAYIPESITLVRNPIKKYVVASYTPGLQKSANGSISIYMSPTLPPGTPPANWLPVPKGLFNIMLRVYGPKGSVARDTFVPPAVYAH